jgi:hypothetical protein
VTDREDEHSSGLRQLMAEAAGQPYLSFGSLTEAQADRDGCVILEGDYGGQLYAVLPARSVRCDEKALHLLLRDLDAISWPGEDEDSARIVYERQAVGLPVAGGMGGGVVAEGGRIHPKLARLGIEQEIRDVLDGRRPRLSDAIRALRAD